MDASKAKFPAIFLYQLIANQSILWIKDIFSKLKYLSIQCKSLTISVEKNESLIDRAEKLWT